MAERLLISGQVLACLFKNEANHYGVFRILTQESEKTLTITGPIADLELDFFYEFEGYYVDNARYGLQFAVELYRQHLPREKDFIIRYLSGPLFPGVGKVIAERIVDLYGETVLEDIRQKELLDLSVKGLSVEKARLIIELVLEGNKEDEDISFLLAHGLSGKQIALLKAVYGDKVQDVLRENPYAPLYDVDGIGLKTVDKLAYSMGFDSDHIYRKEAIVLNLYKTTVFTQGDSYIEYDEFSDKLDPDYQEALTSLLKRRELILVDERLYHYTQYKSESFVSDFMLHFAYDGSDFKIENLDDKIKQIEKRMAMIYDETQRDALHMMIEMPLSIISGGPGTGKSTLLAGFVRLLQENCPWLNIALCAPTGRAAKRLEDLTSVQATTVHSLLKWDLETNRFAMTEENPLNLDLLIIDEFSMVDIWLLANVFKASAHIKKFVFVGDKDQLPSVGPGFVLGDILASQRFASVFLERNYRQEEGSEVIDLALNINQGLFPIEEYHQDVHFYERKAIAVKNTVLDIIKTALDQGYDMDAIQVLAPKYAGSSGIDTLNHFIQKECNPKDQSKNEWIHGGRIFREGDKVLQLKNQPDDFVFNGDIGMIVSIENREIAVDFDGNFVIYKAPDLINLTHAYCISVHKAQGSEYPIVIFVANQQFAMMLSRKLYYTGVSRCSKSLYLVGEKESFELAAQNNHERRRKTYLKELLMEG